MQNDFQSLEKLIGNLCIEKRSENKHKTMQTGITIISNISIQC
jgi:hypothetical protein